MNESNVNRRDFLRGAALGAFGLTLGVEEIYAEAQTGKKPAQGAKPAAAPQATRDEVLSGPPVGISIVGIGTRGRDILTSLAKIGPAANVVSICDIYADERHVRKAQKIAPKAAFIEDYKKVLSDPSVKAVFIATPTHKHKQIALDAIAAGKHIYCEAPLAHTIEEAKEIAAAATAAKTIFQPGLQVRCNAQAVHVSGFMHSGTIGKITGGRANWHTKTKWRFAWPDPEREAELNWRLKKETSPGIIGEIGIHQIDEATWYLKELPISVTGFGGIIHWKDGRSVPDTVQCVVEYPNDVRVIYDATLTNSFGGIYEVFSGVDGAVSLHDQRAWMFKEADSSQLGWEVFARKDKWSAGNPASGSGLDLGTGIALVADATKQLALGNEPGKMGPDVTKNALYYACVGFVKSCQAGKRVFAREPTTDRPNPPLVPGVLEGYQATVVALKANEAVLTGKKIDFQSEMFSP